MMNLRKTVVPRAVVPGFAGAVVVATGQNYPVVRITPAAGGAVLL
jgi:hypothetical protein